VVASQCLVSRSNHDKVAGPNSEAVVEDIVMAVGLAAVHSLSLTIHSLVVALGEAHTSALSRHCVVAVVPERSTDYLGGGRTAEKADLAGCLKIDRRP
jgi:hypothetical protein